MLFEILISLVFSAVILYLFHSYNKWQADRKFYNNLKSQSCSFLSDEALTQALLEADEVGLGKCFREYLDGILQHTGEQRLKIGHLLWIFDQLESGIAFADCGVIPDFTVQNHVSAEQDTP